MTLHSSATQFIVLNMSLIILRVNLNTFAILCYKLISEYICISCVNNFTFILLENMKQETWEITGSSGIRQDRLGKGEDTKSSSQSCGMHRKPLKPLSGCHSRISLFHFYRHDTMSNNLSARTTDKDHHHHHVPYIPYTTITALLYSKLYCSPLSQTSLSVIPTA